MRITLNGKDLSPILASAPVISDQLEAVCRTLEFTVQGTENLDGYLGQTIDLWYGNSRWFTGVLRRRGRKHDGAVTYLAYDPLIFLAKNVDDWYFSGVTAKQAIKQLAEASGVRIKNLANTGAVLPKLYYQGAAADKVAIDQLVRTFKANKKRYWFRYDPTYGAEGLDLFERVVPSKLWAFKAGVNLISANYEESIEDTITVVKLVNRDTGKVVTKVDDVKLKAYGKAVHFEEVDQDKAATMETLAKEYLANLSKLAITQQMTGINPGQTMPQFFSGDFIYVEEKYTGIMGGYHIRNITQTFTNDNLVEISADIEADPHVPEVQFEDATKNPKENTDSGFHQEYSAEVKAIMDQYGIDYKPKSGTTSGGSSTVSSDRAYVNYTAERQAALTEADVKKDLANSGGTVF